MPLDFGTHHALEQLGLGPRLEHEARRGVEGPRDDDLALGLRSTVVRFFAGAASLSLLASIDDLLPFQLFDDLVQRVEA